LISKLEFKESRQAILRAMHDSVDALLASWHETRPDLDFSPVAVVARLGRIRGHIDRELEGVFAAHGLGPASFGALVTLVRLGEPGGVSQRRLMDELGLTSGTISVRIDRLVDAGLVTRRADPESRRNTLIALTERGQELVERVIPAHLDNERRLLAALSPTEQETLAGLLRKLLVEFEGSRTALGLGATLAPAHATIALRASVGLPPVPGLLVRALDEDGPAAAAGLRTGDVLVRAGDRELRSVEALRAAGSGRLELHVVRGVSELDVTVELAPVADEPKRAARGEHRL
jgi:DNA-binding MarR family transcriptional regulator